MRAWMQFITFIILFVFYVFCNTLETVSDKP